MQIRELFLGNPNRVRLQRFDPLCDLWSVNPETLDVKEEQGSAMMAQEAADKCTATE